MIVPKKSASLANAGNGIANASDTGVQGGVIGQNPHVGLQLPQQEFELPTFATFQTNPHIRSKIGARYYNE